MDSEFDHLSQPNGQASGLTRTRTEAAAAHRAGRSPRTQRGLCGRKLPSGRRRRGCRRCRRRRGRGGGGGGGVVLGSVAGAPVARVRVDVVQQHLPPPTPPPLCQVEFLLSVAVSLNFTVTTRKRGARVTVTVTVHVCARLGGGALMRCCTSHTEREGGGGRENEGRGRESER
jgi:hypothetical protein